VRDPYPLGSARRVGKAGISSVTLPFRKKPGKKATGSFFFSEYAQPTRKRTRTVEEKMCHDFQIPLSAFAPGCAASFLSLWWSVRWVRFPRVVGVADDLGNADSGSGSDFEIGSAKRVRPACLILGGLG
jgi:hypothetical protein